MHHKSDTFAHSNYTVLKHAPFQFSCFHPVTKSNKCQFTLCIAVFSLLYENRFLLRKKE